MAKPLDWLPETQGRLSTRVELHPLSQADFVCVLLEPEASLICQYKALLKTEGVNLDFTTDGVEEIALLASEINSSEENIGARRLHVVLERLLEEISFITSEKAGETFTVNAAYSRQKVGNLAKNTDLSRFIL